MQLALSLTGVQSYVTMIFPQQSPIACRMWFTACPMLCIPNTSCLWTTRFHNRELHDSARCYTESYSPQLSSYTNAGYRDASIRPSLFIHPHLSHRSHPRQEKILLGFSRSQGVRSTVGRCPQSEDLCIQRLSGSRCCSYFPTHFSFLCRSGLFLGVTKHVLECLHLITAQWGERATRIAMITRYPCSSPGELHAISLCSTSLNMKLM
jgi:hypothetical protein